MSLNWKNYDEYFSHPRDQQQINANTKVEIERIASKILGLDDETLKSSWGSCSPPGGLCTNGRSGREFHSSSFFRYLSEQGDWAQDFQKGKGLQLVLSHKHLRTKLPGLPNDFVQEVYDAGGHNDTFYLVQEWVEGNSLENFLANQTPTTPEVAIQLLSDFFEGILLPLWSAGTIWWDIQAGNFGVTERDDKQRLVLIDTDSLLAYAEEIIETSQVFTKRNHGKVTALKRIKTILTDLVMLTIPKENLRGSKTKLELQVKSILNEMFAPFEQSGPLQNWAECFKSLEDKIVKTIREL
jgi:serine/threonine protein kinase